MNLKQGILAKNCHSSPCRHVAHPENTSAIARHIVEGKCAHHSNSLLSANKIVENYTNWIEDETSTLCKLISVTDKDVNEF